MTETLEGFERHPHPRLEHIRRVYFWLHLLADFVAGICFVIGSAFFFYDSLQREAAWLFLIGSILFATKPTLRLLHELHHRRASRELAEAAEEVAEVVRSRVGRG